MIFFCCFFFKQKTAYEMRISDWSSDVCSSDLEHVAGHAQQVRIVLAALAERLQRGEVVGIPEPFALAFVQCPVLVAGVGAKVAPQALVQVGLEAIVVQPGVVEIQQENQLGGELAVYTAEPVQGCGSCQPPPPPTLAPPAVWPQA